MMDQESELRPEQTGGENELDASSRAPAYSARKLSVVGIGASAGGLRALQALFSALPADTGMSFVVVVHLSPKHDSMLAELLQPHTEMAVRQVRRRVELEPDHVYVIPPGKRLLVTEGHLELAEFDMPRGKRLQIDTFLRSLGERHGDGAAIILSGSGSDGAVGMQVIKEQGGLLLVQDPSEAEYDGMPKSAIATGLVDVVAPVAELAAQLVEAKRTRSVLDLPTDADALSKPEEQRLVQILAQVRVHSGHDFSGYKRSTVLRRIIRRMQLMQSETLTTYLHRVRQDSEEVEALYRDLLIHVTEFFRDPEAWTALAREVIPRLFEGKGKEDLVRVWSVGCATGEEAYSLAILLLEHAATLSNPPRIQVFASDLGEVALDFARNGYYPQAIAVNISEERLARFFVEENDHYRVRPEVRECILFTAHNLLQDPPFSKLDLISCRNLFIYLQPELQERVLDTFHYGLRRDTSEHGYLFLGTAESADGVAELFEVVDKRQHIYRRRQRSVDRLVLPSLPFMSPTTHRSRQEKETALSVDRLSEGEQHRLLLEEVGPPSILIDESYEILHLSETVGRYMLPPGGIPTMDAIKLVRPELQDVLRAALLETFEEDKAVITRPVPVQFNGAPHLVSVMVRPARQQGRALVLFWEDDKPAEEQISVECSSELTVVEDGGSSQQMARELQRTQQILQTTREEYDTTVEELRAANEELQSTNEEYKSTLEELETSREELQSINEELQAVNQELNEKIEESNRAHSDLRNLLVATDIATLFLDRDLCVKRYTPPAADLFNLMPPDKGRPISHLRSNLVYEDLEVDARRVLTDLVPVEREVSSQEGRWFLVGLRPYRTHDDYIAGVVITFVDITGNKQTETALRESEERYRLLMENVREYAIFMLDTDGVISSWNTGAERIFGYTRQEAIGREASIVFTEEARAAGVPEAEMATAMREGQAADERWHMRRDGSHFWASGVMAALYHPDGSLRGYAKVMRDNTERRDAEERLKAINETLEERVQERTHLVRKLASTLTMAEQEERRRISQILHDDLQQRLYSIQMRMVFVLENAESGDRLALAQHAQEVYKWLDHAIRTTRQLTVDLSPPVLEDEGLEGAVQWLATQMDELHGLAVEIQAHDAVQIPNEDVRVLLFQIVRELLFNVVKHAGVHHVLVELHTTSDELVICVQDEGRGFDVEAAEAEQDERVGMFRVRERLRLFGGHMEIDTAPGEGTLVTAYVPLTLLAGQ